jgi:hypothetical protein
VNPWVILIVAAAALAAVGGAYVQGRADGRDKCLAAEARDEKVAQIASAAAAASSAEAISRIEVKNVYTRQRVEREIQERVVYRDCRHAPDGLRALNAAITGVDGPEPAGSGVVPAASAPGR